MGQWGTLMYSIVGESAPRIQDLFITAISQPQSLEGSTFQSRYKRHFYPRSHMPGDITVDGICRTQADLQSLAYFIRLHQRNLLDTPSGNFQFKTSNNAKRMLSLIVPTENNQWQGFIKSFTMVKKGILQPAPTYTFNFEVIFDNSSQNMGISQRLSHFYTAGTKDPSSSTPPNAVSNSGQ